MRHLIQLGVKLGLGSALSLILLAGCATEPLTTAHLTIGDQTFTVYVADSVAERGLGLGDIEQLASDEGMIFLFTNATQQTFWMKDVEYPIDIVWIKDDQVVNFVTAQPETEGVPTSQYQLYTSPEQVDTVVELSAGTVASMGIQIGDNVALN